MGRWFGMAMLALGLWLLADPKGRIRTDLARYTKTPTRGDRAFAYFRLAWVGGGCTVIGLLIVSGVIEAPSLSP